jgi:hypothetical protein
MTTVEKIKKLEREVTELKSLFSSLVPLDKEGEYRPGFVRKLQKTLSKKVIAGTYSKKGDLLRLLK